ncbi:unnamed protein product [Linum trigynum]|uniref:Uncharacterized protein n=1 Tax=Linum trigynum TaxID=586398 RepID=A0AAV2CT24_9ROSI
MAVDSSKGVDEVKRRGLASWRDAEVDHGGDRSGRNLQKYQAMAAPQSCPTKKTLSILRASRRPTRSPTMWKAVYLAGDEGAPEHRRNRGFAMPTVEERRNSGRWGGT